MSRLDYILGAYALGAQVSADEPPGEIDYSQMSDVELEQVAAREMAAPPVQSVEQPRLLQSPLEGVDDEQWTAWVQAMKVAELATISPAGNLGMFAMKPRRLADLGFMSNPRMERRKGTAAWEGDWIAPLTQDAFLSSPSIQYRVFCASIRLYFDGIFDGTLARDPDGEQGMTLSGALAILHKCGPKGLVRWADEESRKSSTVELFERTNGIF